MRLVSQNGTVDCNYENGNLSIGCVRHEDGTEDVRVYYYSSASPRGTLLAKYASESQVIKAMKMLHEAYTGKLICQNVDLSDDKVVELLKNWNMQAITVANSDTTRCDYINNTVFQFPADENVEVEDEVERS